MTDLTTLQPLRDRIEAATEPSQGFYFRAWRLLVGPVFFTPDGDRFATLVSHRAYLDACAALQERVLPGTARTISYLSAWIVTIGVVEESDHTLLSSCKHKYEPLAWLLAIVNAKIAEVENATN